jgi:outer membrane protein
MKKMVILLPALLAVLLLQGQSALDLSVEEARQMALQHQAEFQIRKLDQQIADLEFRQGRRRFLPQWTISYDARANLILPTTIVPGEPFDQPQNLPVQFGTLYTQAAGIELEQTVYDRALREDQRLLSLNRQIAAAQTALGQDDSQLAAVKAYYNVLVQRARLQQQEAAIARLQLDVAETDSMVQAGSAPLIELERFQNAFKNAILEKDRVRYDIELAEHSLKKITGLPPGQPIRLTDTLDVNRLQATMLLVPVIDPPQLNDFAAYRLEQLFSARIEEDIVRQKASAAPRIAAYGYFGGQAFTNALRDDFPWYGVSFVGLRASWRLNPIWDNPQILPKYQLLKRQSDIRLGQIEEDLRYNAEQARLKLIQAIDEAEIQVDNVAFARKELDYFYQRFRNKQSTAKEVMSAEQDLSRAEIGLLLSVYNVSIVRYEFLKAKGGL